MTCGAATATSRSTLTTYNNKIEAFSSSQILSIERKFSTRQYCEQHNIEYCELFADEIQSGTKQSLPGLDRKMKAVENVEIETVVVYAFSLYARSVSHMLKGLEIMRARKTKFVSLTEKLDLNTSPGHVVFEIIAAIVHLTANGGHLAESFKKFVLTFSRNLKSC